MKVKLCLWEKLGCLLSRNNVGFWFGRQALVTLVITSALGSSPGVAVAEYGVAEHQRFTTVCPQGDGGINICERDGNIGPVAFSVYTNEEVRAQLQPLKEAIDSTNATLKATAEDIRTQVRDSVTKALRDLPPQLFSSEVLERLINKLATQLEASLQAQEERLRAELLEEIARRLPGH